VLADLPRTGIGKISRSRLRASAKDRNRSPTS